MRILHIDTSILGDASVSRLLSRAIVDRLIHQTPGMGTTYRDLAARPLAHLTGATFAALSGEPAINGAVQDDVDAGGQALEEFLAADTVVIGVAFYNFGISSQLKTWVDRITIPGKTFRYTDQGPQGLAGDKRLILAIARGGLYGPDSGRQSFEHAETYLRSLFGFLGIAKPEVIVAEGLKMPDRRQTSIDAALREIAALPA